MITTLRKLTVLWCLCMSSLAFCQGYPAALTEMIDQVYFWENPNNTEQGYLAVTWKKLSDSTPAAREAQISIPGPMLSSFIEGGAPLLFWGRVDKKTGPNSEITLEGALNQQHVSAGSQNGTDYTFELRRNPKNLSGMNYEYPKVFFHKQRDHQFVQFWKSSAPTKIAKRYYNFCELVDSLPKWALPSFLHNPFSNSSETYLKEHAGQVVPAFFPAHEGQVIGKYDPAPYQWVNALKQGLQTGTVTLKMLHDYGENEMMYPLLPEVLP